MNHITVLVKRKRQEAIDIVSLELVRPDGSDLPAFSAGAHINLHIGPDLIRQYSLCNNPSERHRYVIAVLRDPVSRGGSAAIHDDVQEGDLLDISSPRNHFPLVRARRSLLFAGGIGVTPMLCMAEQLGNMGADFEMHYCARATSRTAFIERLKTSEFAAKVYLHVDDGADAQKLDLEDLLGVPDHSVHVFVCGPGGFIHHVKSTAESYGWRSENLHSEYFGAADLDTSQDSDFAVRIASTGITIPIPSGQAVTDVLRGHGIEIDVACQRGVCGTCLTHLVAGEPEHRDLYLTATEKAGNELFLPCCSRAKSPLLVLDL